MIDGDCAAIRFLVVGVLGASMKLVYLVERRPVKVSLRESSEDAKRFWGLARCYRYVSPQSVQYQAPAVMIHRRGLLYCVHSFHFP